jgi:hypothetical protein
MIMNPTTKTPTTFTHLRTIIISLHTLSRKKCTTNNYLSITSATSHNYYTPSQHSHNQNLNTHSTSSTNTNTNNHQYYPKTEPASTAITPTPHHTRNSEPSKPSNYNKKLKETKK